MWGGRKMVQWVKALASKPDNLSSALESRRLEENGFPQVVFSPTQGDHACTLPTHKANKQ